MCITLYIQFGRELIANILSVATVISWLYLLKSMLGDFYSSLFHMFVLFNPSQLQSFILHCYSAVGLKEWRLHVIRDCRGYGDNCTSGSNWKDGGIELRTSTCKHSDSRSQSKRKKREKMLKVKGLKFRLPWGDEEVKLP